MRKRVGTISTALLIMSFCLSGCVSEKEYRDLTSRVEYLESLHGVGNSSHPVAETTETSAKPSAKDNVKENVDEGLDDYFLYYVDNMTAEEIASECEYYFTNMPYKGETYEEYESTLKVAPYKASAADYQYQLLYKFYTSDYDYDVRIPEKDAIKAIRISGVEPQMDGTIGFGTNSYNPKVTVSVELWISDYEKAAKVYDLIFNYSSPNYQADESAHFYGDQLVDSRETTTWYADGVFQNSKNSWSNERFMTMEKKDSFYVLTVQYSTLVYGIESTAKPIDNGAIGTATVRSASLNVRSSPDQTSTRLGALVDGQRVDLMAITENGIWAKIKFNGQIGYVKTEFIEIAYK